MLCVLQPNPSEQAITTPPPPPSPSGVEEPSTTTPTTATEPHSKYTFLGDLFTFSHAVHISTHYRKHYSTKNIIALYTIKQHYTHSCKWASQELYYIIFKCSIK